jgi:hypothetical protein
MGHPESRLLRWDDAVEIRDVVPSMVYLLVDRDLRLSFNAVSTAPYHFCQSKPNTTLSAWRSVVFSISTSSRSPLPPTTKQLRPLNRLLQRIHHMHHIQISPEEPLRHDRFLLTINARVYMD